MLLAVCSFCLYCTFSFAAWPLGDRTKHSASFYDTLANGQIFGYEILADDSDSVRFVDWKKGTADNGNVIVPRTVTHEGHTYKVTQVGPKTFYDNKDVTCLDFEETESEPSNVTYIGMSTFDISGINLEAVKKGVEPGWTLQRDSALHSGHCSFLTKLVIPSSVRYVDSLAFMYPVRCDSVIIKGSRDPACPTYLNHFAFCDSLIILGEKEGNCPFWLNDSSGGEMINVEYVMFGDEDGWIDTKDLDSYLFHQALWLKEITLGNVNLPLDFFSNDSIVRKINILGNVTNIKNTWDDDVLPSTAFATIFETCRNVETINIGPKVTTIPDYLFSSCTDNEYDYPDHFRYLTKVTIPDNVQTIGKNAFYGCVALDTMIIGTGVKTIGDSCFYACPKLSTVYENRPVDSLKVEVPEAGEHSFSTVTDSCTLIVPEDAAEYYGSFQNTQATAVGWDSIPNLREISVTVPMTTNEGYVTRYSPYSYVLEPGLEGGVITNADSNGKLTIDWLYDGDDPEKDTVPADLAILVKGPENAISENAENHSFTNWTFNTDTTAHPKPSGNMLHGTVVNKSGAKTYVLNENGDTISNDYYFYKLSYYTKVDSVFENNGTDTDTIVTYTTTLGFYWGEEDGGPITLVGSDSRGAYSGVKLAWLAIPKSTFTNTNTNAKGVFYPLEDADENTPDDNDSEMGTTGITSVATRADSDVIYNLQGVRVNDMSKKGIYIVNGRKVIKN